MCITAMSMHKPALYFPEIIWKYSNFTIQNDSQVALINRKSWSISINFR